MADIKPIETVYNGYRFRSRLEARWAVFFDAAGIDYEYEPEGYECNGIKYLPDFYLPELDTHIEVKVDRDGFENDIIRCSKMIQWGGKIKTIVFLGNIPSDSDGGHWHFPAWYYVTGGDNCVTSGWWFFQDCYDENDNPYVTGHVSSMSYPRPFYIDDDGTLYGAGKTKPSVNPVSDRYLKPHDSVKDVPQIYLENGYTKESWEQFLKDSITSMNERFYSSLRKARQARFEHGECG